MKIVIDMNLSPGWCEVLEADGREAQHWSDVGDPRAEDTTILGWARENGHVVFTHDLDFGTLLALTHADGPSVIQVRTQDVLPERIGDLVTMSLRQFEAELDAGALVVIDESKTRARLLPIAR